MSAQPHLFSETPAPPPPSTPAPPPPVDAGGPIWLQRLSLFILVLFCVYLGVIVAWLPWWKAIWDENLYFQSHPQLWAILRLGPVRGVISGLGLLDIWIGVSEAIHYRETPSEYRETPTAPPHA